MGRKKIGLVNYDNHNAFIDYISARSKKLVVERVSKLIKLIADDKKQYHDRIFEFSNEFGVYPHEPSTLTKDHVKLITEIEIHAFSRVNAFIDEIDGLKISFKNAQAQARYKKKNKLTDNERFIIECNADEYLYIKMLKELCKKDGIKLEDQLKTLYRYLHKQKKRKA